MPVDWSQFDRLIRSFTNLGARRIAILGISGVFVSAFVLVASYFAGRTGYETLYVGLTPQDVSRMGMVLGESGIPFEASIDGTKLSVPFGEAGRARALLAEKGLPGSATAGYELFDKLGALGLTSFMQQVTRERALEGELTRTIQNLKGVKAARVHLVLPDPSALRASRQTPSASVVIKTDSSGGSSPATAIRHLVAAAIPEMIADQVSVISTDGTVLASSGGDSSAQLPAKSVELERTLANQVQDNVRRTLTPYLGLENFEVSANVRVNLDKRQTSETAFDPDTKVERSVRVVKEAQSAQEPSGKSIVSVEQNVPNEGGSTSNTEQSKRAQDRKEETTNYEIGSKSTQTTSEGYRIENVSVAIVVNKKRMAETLGKEPTAEELSKAIEEVEKLARSSAGLDEKRGDQINVAMVNFSAIALQDDPNAGTWSATLTNLVSTAIKSITILALGFIVVWAGFRPLTRALSLQSPGRQAPPALEAPSASALAASSTLDVPTIEPRFADDFSPPLETESADGARAGVVSSSASGPQKRLEELFYLDEEQSLTIIKNWVRNR